MAAAAAGALVALVGPALALGVNAITFAVAAILIAVGLIFAVMMGFAAGGALLATAFGPRLPRLAI